MLTTTNERLGRAVLWLAVVLGVLHATPDGVSAETIHLRCGTLIDGISNASRESVNPGQRRVASMGRPHRVARGREARGYYRRSGRPAS